MGSDLVRSTILNSAIMTTWTCRTCSLDVLDKDEAANHRFNEGHDMQEHSEYVRIDDVF